MNVNIYKFRSQQEKMLADGQAMAQAKMLRNEKKLEYVGNELVTKIQRHNGENMYLLREEVVKDLLEYIIYINEAAEYVFGCENLNRNKNKPAIEKSFMYFVANVKPEKMYLDSLAKCYTGTPMLSYFRDEKALEKQREFDEKRQALADKWTL